MDVDVRQAVLVSHPVYDDTQISEKLALFDEVTGAAYPFDGEDWRVVSDSEMSNGWRTVGYPGNEVQYRKRPNGMVELRGLIMGGQVGPIFKLPEGYGHAAPWDMHWPVACQDGIANFSVSPDGMVNAVQLMRGDAEWYSLAPIIYSVD